MEPKRNGKKKAVIDNDDAHFIQSCLALRDTIKKLRSPTGCPWDREQTIASLTPFLIEEAYEAVLAASKIKENDKETYADYCDELGDVLLQVFLNATIAAENNNFSIIDVFEAINKKMIRRHPHVFATNSNNIKTATDVVNQWGDIKKTEKVNNDFEKCDSIMIKMRKKSSLPTLNYGCEISKKSLSVGFSWLNIKDIFAAFEDEVKELSHEIFSPNMDVHKVADETGDVIYSLCNVITFLQQSISDKNTLNLDSAARNAFEKFLTRFETMEKIRQEQNNPLTEDVAKSLNLDTWDALWKQAKVRLAK